MSTKVAVVYEDHTNDRYIIEPVVIAALRALGVSRPRVSPITNPRMTGFSSLLRDLCSVVTRYEKTVSILVVAFDVDGEDGLEGRSDKRKKVLTALSKCESSAENVVLLGAINEAEVYALWGSRTAIVDSWAEVRAERDPKEFYFDALLLPSDAMSVDGGRARLTSLSLRPGWASIKNGCPELQTFEDDLGAVLNQPS